MSTPNMSGRSDDPSTDDSDHLSPSDLIGEDGTVSASIIASVANRGGRPLITATECAAIRETLATDDTTAQSVAAEYGYGSTAIRNHATGRCSCQHDTPTVAYDRAEGWIVDE